MHVWKVRGKIIKSGPALTPGRVSVSGSYEVLWNFNVMNGLSCSRKFEPRVGWHLISKNFTSSLLSRHTQMSRLLGLNMTPIEL